MPLTLPMVAMMDTSVFLCRLGDKAHETDAPYCIDFCNRMVKEGYQLYVSAPTIAEVTRFRGHPCPRVPSIRVAPFDEQAATLLGMRMPQQKLKDHRQEIGGRSLGHIKYDALIVGCALRIPGCVFVSMDEGQLKLATHCGLPAHHPRDYHEPVAAKPPVQSGLFEN